jgi:hypothetical protein
LFFLALESGGNKIRRDTVLVGPFSFCTPADAICWPAHQDANRITCVVR